jgi:hypothetical protein
LNLTSLDDTPGWLAYILARIHRSKDINHSHYMDTNGISTPIGSLPGPAQVLFFSSFLLSLSRDARYNLVCRERALPFGRRFFPSSSPCTRHSLVEYPSSPSSIGSRASYPFAFNISTSRHLLSLLGPQFAFLFIGRPILFSLFQHTLCRLHHFSCLSG